MKGAGIRAFASPVELLEVPELPLVEGEQVLIEVRAAGVGNWDDVARRGEWDLGVRPPMVLGVEAAGTVTSVGPLVSRFAPGDEVIAFAAPLTVQGSWADRFVVPSSFVAAKPRAMAWPAAGAFAVPALTAVEVVRSVRIRAGEAVLVNGASGVTGGMIVAAASWLGARVAATCSERVAQRVLAYGASTTFDYRDPNWQDDALQFAPDGYGAVINAARGQAANVLALLEDRGRLATLTGDPPREERSISVINFYVAPDGGALEAAARKFAGLGLDFPIASIGGLEDASKFLATAVRGEAQGAQVLTPR